MKTLKYTITLLSLICLSHFSADAQTYKSAIGLRLGYPLSASFKTFLNEKGAVEVFAGYRNYGSLNYNWFNAGGLYEHHLPISSVENLSWYFGGGAAVYFWNYDFVTDESSTSIGILGTVGLDYKFANAPVNISADWVPAFFVNGYGSGFGGGFGALAVRYVLGGGGGKK